MVIASISAQEQSELPPASLRDFPRSESGSDSGSFQTSASVLGLEP